MSKTLEEWALKQIDVYCSSHSADEIEYERFKRAMSYIAFDLIQHLSQAEVEFDEKQALQEIYTYGQADDAELMMLNLARWQFERDKAQLEAANWRVRDAHALLGSRDRQIRALKSSTAARILCMRDRQIEEKDKEIQRLRDALEAYRQMYSDQVGFACHDIADKALKGEP